MKNQVSSEAFLRLKNKIRGAAGVIRAKGFEVFEKDVALRAKIQVKGVLSDARRELSAGEYESFLLWTTTFLATQAPTIERSGHSFSGLGLIVTKPPLSLDREIVAACSRLALNVDVIKEFRRYSSHLERLVWLDKTDAIRDTLNQIEETFGQSLWLIQANIAIKQLIDGLEAQKHYAQSIRKEARGSLAAYFAHYMSVRNEPNITIPRFSEDMSARLFRSKSPPSERIYLNLRLADNWPSTDGGIASVLQVEQTTTIIDLYETLIRVLQRIAAFGTTDHLREIIVGGLNKLTLIDDPRIQKLIILLDKASQRLDVTAAAPANSFAFLLAGNLVAARDEASTTFTSDPANVNELLTIAFCDALTGQATRERSRVGILVRNLSAIYTKSEDFDRAASETLRITRNLSFLPSFKSLRLVCELECFPRSSEVIARLRSRFLNNAEVDRRDLMSGLDLDAELIEKISAAPISSSIGALIGISQDYDIDGVHPELVKAIGTLKALWDDRHTINTAELCQLARDVKVPRAVRLMISLRLTQYLITEGDLGGAADQVCFEFVREPAIIRVLPLSDLLGVDGWRSLKPHAQQLSVPIVLDLQWRESNNDQDATNRRFAIQQFLSKNNFKKPSDIEHDSAQFPRDELVYFFGNVCVPTAIDMLPSLVSSTDIDEERKRICEILVGLDPRRTDAYQDEILNIINKKIVQSGLQIVDRSRVHVETDSIIRWAKKELEESFYRYQSLVKAGIGIADNFDDVLKRILRAERPDEYLQLPTSEADELLIEIVSALREQFLFDGTHGLDSYLSQRIRHGSIQNYLRSPVEAAQLVTLKKTTGGTYETNKYWLAKLVPVNSSDGDQIEKIFQEFGHEFDGLILRMKDHLLNVHSKEKPEGLLRMDIASPTFHLLRSIVQSVETVEEFVRLCVPFFWGILEPSLRLTRDVLRGDIKKRFALAFEVLRIKLRDTVRDDTDGYAELSTAIGDASAKVQSELDRIASWLERQEVQESQQKYTLRQAFDVAIESVLSSHKTFKPNLQIDIVDDATVSAGELIVLADVMRVALGNVDAHANTRGPPTVWIAASVNDVRETLTIRCESDVGRGVRSAEVDLRLEAIRNRIQAGAYTEALRTEGGSGMMRLANLVRQSALGRLEFGFKEDHKFAVEVDLSFFFVVSPRGN